MKQFLSCLLLLGLVGCSSPAPNPTQSDVSHLESVASNSSAAETIETDVTIDPCVQKVQEMLQSMTLEEKVGQMFFVRCPSANASELVSQYHLGGYILFGPDFKDKTAQQVKDTIAEYQSHASIPLLIGSDEEGGTVTRASRNPNLFPSPSLSPQTLYTQGGMEAILSDVSYKSEILLDLGVNVNLAPVADVSTNPDDFMYDRSFGQDAVATADYVGQVVAQMKTSSIGSVLKHFPGYGNNTDTHTGIAIDERPYETFETSDFLPFQSGIEMGADAVLVSHNLVISMDPNLPASLSPAVHTILRDELDFEGVVMTDDLAMEAVAAYAEDGSVAVLAVQAGNDMIVTTDFETQIPLVLSAVQSGELSQTQIDTAVTRILTWKYHLGLLN